MDMSIRVPQPTVIDLPLIECEYGPGYDAPSKCIEALLNESQHRKLQQAHPRIYSVYTSFIENGQKYPIIVVANKGRPGYWIHAGNMRWTVALALGMQRMTARVATDKKNAEELRKMNYMPPHQCGRCNQEFFVSHRCPKLKPSP